jgi:hypothetical protein
MPPRYTRARARAGDGTGEGLVRAYYSCVGWPTFLPTAEQVWCVGGVRGVVCCARRLRRAAKHCTHVHAPSAGGANVCACAPAPHATHCRRARLRRACTS